VTVLSEVAVGIVAAEDESIHPHNAPLQMWMELGFPGAFLFTAIVTVILLRVWPGKNRLFHRLANLRMKIWYARYNWEPPEYPWRR
jgi:O-antigen ligase